MKSAEIRTLFLQFFESKQHLIVPSAPIVLKDDPTLMFTNAGMNQFKDVFLGHGQAKSPRIADTQKCLRVSGKHNDLEEVGVDTYHHTMFEMLGNWSFGDYFKKEAIDWAWELLTGVYKIDKERIYVTVFEGDASENLAFDDDAKKCWLKYLTEERIINGNKKDNFWEMGETGPCGPCSEVHVDMRNEEERKKTAGRTLVNTGNPQVIEIWNLVFMEFNRKADGKLEKLPAQHVDTGMGFERLTMVLQGKQSTYDTDIFQPVIKELEKLSSWQYNLNTFGQTPFEIQIQEKVNIAMRVIADHIRAISFSIADGQIPSNNGAGYVIRRILRRAVRYGYQWLNLKEPFLYELVDILVKEMGEFFPEIVKQHKLIKKVIQEEEQAFLRTLEKGIQRITSYMASIEEMLPQYILENTDFKKTPDGDVIDAMNKSLELGKDNIKRLFVLPGNLAFELYDTYGFPLDLTQLIVKDYNSEVDIVGFNKALEEQKTRSRKATSVDTGDWVDVNPQVQTVFTGYESLEEKSNIIKYRKTSLKGKDQYQIVLDKTPFYAESGGQVGDVGFLESNGKRIRITNTQKENNLIIHYSDELPANVNDNFTAIVDSQRRIHTADNHSATHLLHAALRKVLGKHVEQRGSLVSPDYLRFDFSHFSKLTDEELSEIESLVNQKIRENITCSTQVLPIDEAKKLGAMALFGEKYGDTVRVVTIDKNYSIELCGGTHVKATGQIGYFKILSESALSAGIRRIEAVTALGAENYMHEQIETLRQASYALKNPKNIVKAIQDMQQQASDLSKQVEKLSREQGVAIKASLINKKQEIGSIIFIGEKIEITSADVAKDICFQLKSEIPNLFMILGAEVNGKANLFLAISENLMKEKSWNASALIREFSKEIQGGGGGQAFYATAGGTNIAGIPAAIAKAKQWAEQNK
jgi:alanyl-tRNA synthetase